MRSVFECILSARLTKNGVTRTRLMNKQVDDEVIVKAPKGDRELEILEIRFD